MPERMRRRGLNLGLSALVVVLAGLVVWQAPSWFSLPGAAAGKASQSRSHPARAVAPAASPERNPFLAPAGRAPLPVRSPELGVTVYGVVIGEGQRMVLAGLGSDGPVRRLRPGDHLGPYRIVEIHPDRLVLRRGPGGPQREIRWLKRSP
jgi:hypothetical protein